MNFSDTSAASAAEALAAHRLEILAATLRPLRWPHVAAKENDALALLRERRFRLALQFEGLDPEVFENLVRFHLRKIGTLRSHMRGRPRKFATSQQCVFEFFKEEK